MEREGVKWGIVGHDINEFYVAIRKNHSKNSSVIISHEILKNNIINIWDIGANIGAVSLPLLKKFNYLNIVLFEPSAEVAGRLINNLYLNPELSTRAYVMNIALSNSSGIGNFYVSNESFNSGVTGLAASLNRLGFSVGVQTYTGDELISLHNFKAPELIKIDVEGFELEVFQGLKNFLIKNHPIIIFEHSAYRFSERKIPIDSVTSLLLSIGYNIYNINTSSLITENDLLVDSDFIAKK